MSHVFKNDLMVDLTDRGFIHSTTADTNLENALSEPCVIYCGFDCTADSLHIGSLVQLKMLKKFKDAGHVVVPVIGTATTKIGDPSGRDTARPLLTDEEIDRNARGIEFSISNVVDADEVIHNHEFIEELDVVDFMRNIGSKISINTMMNLESVRSRMEGDEGMSFLEFSYSLFQAYDFYNIINENPTMHVIQIGGSDQWGNITMGLELAKKMWDSKNPMKEAFGITTPLLTSSNGQKMGKTADGVVWLNGSKMTALDFWQFWRNIPDDDLFHLLRLFSDSSLELINHMDEHGSETDGYINMMKKSFACEMTSMIRGNDESLKAAKMAESIFEDKSDIDLPEHKVDRECMVSNLALTVFLREEGFMKSSGEAKRMIQQGGIRIDNVKVDDVNTIISSKGESFKLSIGQKKHYRIEFE